MLDKCVLLMRYYVPKLPFSLLSPQLIQKHPAKQIFNPPKRILPLFRFQLTLQDSHRVPISPCQLCLFCPITFPVAPHFLNPEFSICLVYRVILAVPVSETVPDENSGLVFQKEPDVISNFESTFFGKAKCT